MLVKYIDVLSKAYRSDSSQSSGRNSSVHRRQCAYHISRRMPMPGLAGSPELGILLGYLSGYADLPRHIPWLGNTQMQVLCSIAAIAILSTVAISSVYVKERDPREDGPPAQGNPGLISFFRQTYGAMVRLPPRIRKVCEAQFFNWLGWFGSCFIRQPTSANFIAIPISPLTLISPQTKSTKSGKKQPASALSPCLSLQLPRLPPISYSRCSSFPHTNHPRDRNQHLSTGPLATYPPILPTPSHP